MDTKISVPVSTRLFLELAGFLKEEGSNRDPVEAIEDAICYWMDNASWKKDALMPEASSDETLHGFTWKYKDDALFMPDGTEIRMRYMGRYHYAKVVGDEILYEGASVSPASLANTITKSSRNAWRDLWIKTPSSKQWQLADQLRRESRSITQEIDRLIQES